MMAANINNLPQRFDFARTERDDDNNNNEAATPDGQSAQPAESTIAAPSEQQGQSGGDGYGGGGNGADAHDPSTPSPVPLEADALAPSYMRFGIGDTVIMGRPDYVRMQTERERAQPGEVEPSPREPSLREPNPRLTALAPTPRAENTPLPLSTATATTASTTTAKPIPLPKPGGNTSPTSAATSSPPVPTITFPPVTGAAITNAPILAGEAVEPPAPPSNRVPYLTNGLHTAPEQSPHYANALAYGREHGYKDDEVMKLAVLMQNNGDQNMGHEWLTLKPDVLRVAVNAVVRNADNSFDTSGVFGGRQGYLGTYSTGERVPADAATAAYNSSSEGGQQSGFTQPEGWALVEETVATGSGGDGGDAGTTTLHYYVPPVDPTARRGGTQPLLAALGYVQVEHGVESELSVGCGWGYRDLSRFTFHPDFGLITTPDNYIPHETKDDVGGAIMGLMAVGFTVLTGVPASQFVAGGATVTESAIYAGAINGAVGSMLFTAAAGGEVTFKGILQGAITGGVLGGLSEVSGFKDLRNLGLNPDTKEVTSYLLRAVSITGQATIKGALREVLGGHFRDGFKQGMFEGLAAEISSAINGDVKGRLDRGEISPDQARALNEMSTFTGSMIRAAASPNDPAYAFAQDYLGQLLGPGGATVPEVRGTAFDDDGNLMPGIVDPKAPLEDQSRQIYDALVSRGMKPDEAAELAGDYYDRTWLSNVQNARPTLTDPVAIQQRMGEIDEALRQQIRAQELNEASLGGGELLEVGGGSGIRPPPQISTNRGVENALNLAADPAGVLGPIQELRGSFTTLDRINVEESINSYRQKLIDLGVPNVPTGYAENIGGPDGRTSRDYGGTIDSLERAYANHLENARYASQYGEGWKDVRIGRSNMTVQEFEQQVFQRTQASVDAAYTRGRQQMSNGSLAITYNENYTLGRYIDEQTRVEMREFARSQGIPDNQGSQFMAVNRRITGADGTYGTPDLRLGNSLLIDYTLANKTPYSSQIRSWANIQPLVGVLIVRPTAYGGSYVIPPASIPKPKPPRG